MFDFKIVESRVKGVGSYFLWDRFIFSDMISEDWLRGVCEDVCIFGELNEEYLV